VGRRYDLGSVPRTAVARFTYADGRVSAEYVVPRVFETPDGVLGVEIRQLPDYPGDYPGGDVPGWMNIDDPVPVPPGPPARPEIRGPGRFRPPPGT